MDIDKQFHDLQNITQESNKYRDQLIQKLLSAANTIHITPDNDRSTITDAKLNVLKTIDELLKSKEQAVMSQIKLALNKKDSDAITQGAEIVADFLKKINPAMAVSQVTTNINDPSVEEALEKRFEEEQIPEIKEEELEINTDLKCEKEEE